VPCEQIRALIQSELKLSVPSNFIFIEKKGWPLTFTQEKYLLGWDVVNKSLIRLILPKVGKDEMSQTDSLSDLDRLNNSDCLTPMSYKSLRSKDKLHHKFLNREISFKQSSPSKRVNKIMISYARIDAMKYALQLKTQLISTGFEVFLDADNILPGQDWQNELAKAINECHVFVALVTRYYGITIWTEREIRLADKKNKTIIPINFLDNWPPEHLAFQFMSIEFIPWKRSLNSSNDVTDNTWDSKSVSEIAETIRKICESKQSSYHLEASSTNSDFYSSSIENESLSSLSNASSIASISSTSLLDNNCNTEANEFMLTFHSKSPSCSRYPLIVIISHPTQAFICNALTLKLIEIGYDVWAPNCNESLKTCSETFNFDMIQIFKNKIKSAKLILFIFSEEYFDSKICRMSTCYCLFRKRTMAIECDNAEMPLNLRKAICENDIIRISDDLNASMELIVQRIYEINAMKNTRLYSQEVRLQKLVKRLKRTSIFRQNEKIFIYIIGNLSSLDREKYSLCQKIGSYLAEADSTIALVTDGLDGPGDLIGRSFFKIREKDVVHIIPERHTGCNEFKPLTKDKCLINRLSYGKTILIGNSLEERDKIVGRVFNCCLLVGEDPSVENVVENFIFNDNYVIPIMCNQNSSLSNFNVNDIPQGIDEDQWTILRKEKDPEKISKSILRIVFDLFDHIKSSQFQSVRV